MARKRKKSGIFEEKNQGNFKNAQCIEHDKNIHIAKMHMYTSVLMMLEDFNNIYKITDKNINDCEAVLTEYGDDEAFMKDYSKSQLDYMKSILENFLETHSDTVYLLQEILSNIKGFYNILQKLF